MGKETFRVNKMSKKYLILVDENTYRNMHVKYNALKIVELDAFSSLQGAASKVLKNNDVLKSDTECCMVKNSDLYSFFTKESQEENIDEFKKLPRTKGEDPLPDNIKITRVSAEWASKEAKSISDNLLKKHGQNIYNLIIKHAKEGCYSINYTFEDIFAESKSISRAKEIVSKILCILQDDGYKTTIISIKTQSKINISWHHDR